MTECRIKDILTVIYAIMTIQFIITNLYVIKNEVVIFTFEGFTRCFKGWDIRHL